MKTRQGHLRAKGDKPTQIKTFDLFILLQIIHFCICTAVHKIDYCCFRNRKVKIMAFATIQTNIKITVDSCH